MELSSHSGERIRIVAVGFYLPGTGFARVLQSTFTRLGPRYDVHLIGIGYRGPVVEGESLTLHPCSPKGGDAWGIAGLRDLAKKLSAHIVFILNDPWYMKGYLDGLESLGNSVTKVVYFPLDGSIRDPNLVAPLSRADRVVVYTEFARKEVAHAAAALGIELRVDVIPHGVDTDAFRRSAKGATSADARRALFPDDATPDEFVVLNANRPNPRKRIDLTMQGFARFAEGKPAGVRLHLHHAVMSDEERERTLTMARDCGIEKRLRLTPAAAAPVPKDNELNLIYQAADVGINTALGEGWGLVSFEHAATGVAQIVPAHSACEELWRGSAEMIEPVRDVEFPPFLTTHREVSADGVAQALERVYGDRGLLQTLADAGYGNATRREYSWDAVAERWNQLFLEALDKHAAERLGPK